MGAGLEAIALEHHQLADLWKGEPKVLGTPDKLYPANVARVEEAKTTFGSRRAVQKPLLFIEPYGIDTHARPFGHLPDLNPALVHTVSGYTLEFTLESSKKITGKNPAFEFEDPRLVFDPKESIQKVNFARFRPCCHSFR